MKQEFCDFIRIKNEAYQNKEEQEARKEIAFLKETCITLSNLNPTEEIIKRRENLNKQIKTYENLISGLNILTPEDLLENLKEDERIDHVILSPTSINVITKDVIFCKCNIGKYSIQIDFSYYTGNIKIVRLNGAMNNRYDHIFIVENRPCFGDKSRQVYLSLRRGGFYSIIQLAISLLYSSQSDERGAYISSSAFLRGIRN